MVISASGRLARATFVNSISVSCEVPDAWLPSAIFCFPERAAWIVTHRSAPSHKSQAFLSQAFLPVDVAGERWHLDNAVTVEKGRRLMAVPGVTTRNAMCTQSTARRRIGSPT